MSAPSATGQFENPLSPDDVEKALAPLRRGRVENTAKKLERLAWEVLAAALASNDTRICVPAAMDYIMSRKGHLQSRNAKKRYKKAREDRVDRDELLEMLEKHKGLLEGGTPPS